MQKIAISRWLEWALVLGLAGAAGGCQAHCCEMAPINSKPAHGLVDDAKQVSQLEKAITDGRKMGLSDRYLNHIDRTIHQEVLPRQNNDAFRTSYGHYERMEAGSASHERYEILESTLPRLEQYKLAPPIRPRYATYVNVITPRPRYQDFHDLDGNVVFREIRYADERPYRPRCDTGRQSETRERRGDRSPTRPRQSRGRDERSGAGSSRLVILRNHIGGRPEYVVERRRRSSSTP